MACLDSAPMPSRRVALAVATAVLCVALGLAKAASNDWYETRDFHCFWAAGRLVALGSDPYDPAGYQALVAGEGAISAQTLIHCGARFPFPPWTALLLAPFGALPLPLASTLWVALFLGATTLGLYWSWSLSGGGRRWPPLFLALVLASEPFLLALENAQFGAITLALCSGALVLMENRRDRSAGAALAALLIKPQLVIVSLPALLIRAALQRRLRIVAGASMVAGLTVVASVALLPGSPAVLAGYAGRTVGATVPLASVWDLGGSLGLPFLAPIVIALLAIATVALVAGRPVDDTGFAGLAVAFSLAVTPYAWSYDYILLALPWALTLGRISALRDIRGPLLLALQVAVASPLAWGVYLLAFVRGGETLSPLVPICSTLLLALAIRLGPRQLAEHDGPRLH